MKLQRIIAAALVSLSGPSFCEAASAYHGKIVHDLKHMQQQALFREPAERAEKLERARAARGRKSFSARPSIRSGHRARRRPGPGNDLAAVTPFSAPPPTAATVANRRVSDRTGEPSGAAQSEVSVAAIGDNLVAAYNDGIGFYGAPWPEDTQGYSYSTDRGATWTDGGAVPNAGQFVWISDPVVAVNEKTGAFYYCGLVDIPGGLNGVAVLKGTFSGSTFSWQTPTIVEQQPNTSALLDKPWMAADSTTGNLYVTYAHFVMAGGTVVSNNIRFERSTDDNLTWTGNQALSAPTDAGFVQGSRPAVGPSGEVHVVWHAIGQFSGPNANSPFGRDFLRVRKSTNGGVSFAAQVTADSVFSNFGNGAPGFNRGVGLTFPAIAVDRSIGPNRGRVYLSWNESLNFYNDPFPEAGIDPARGETESNNGTANATFFDPANGNGEILRGTISVTGNPGDLDYWRWNAVQGQTVIFYLDSLAAGLDAAFRIFCSDGSTLLAFSQNGVGRPGLLVFTVPTTATYYMRVASYTGTGTGRYRVLATLDTPQADRGRDHRDLFVKSSVNGTTWGPTARVNDDPAWLDGWLPEVAVDGSGRTLVAAYDWRDSPEICAGGSNVYLYRSVDAGQTWSPGSRVTDVTTNWTTTLSSMIPNQGDYIGLFAAGSTAQIAWGDGRDGDPDVYGASVSLVPSGLRADAGNDTTVECAPVADLGTPVRLDGTASEGALTYLWTCPGVVFDASDSPTPTGYFPHGANEVVLEVGDGTQTLFDTVRVTVTDTSPPSLTVSLSPASLWPPNHALAAVRATVDAQDACGQSDIRLVSIQSSEPDDSPEPGDVPGDIQDADFETADFEFRLRAERSGSGPGRTYTVCYQAEDPGGHSLETCAQVIVPHDQRGRARLDQTFATSRLVLLGSGTMLASSVDPASAQLGTLDFRRIPLQDAVHGDRDGDGFPDLALLVPDEDLLEIPASEPLFARWLAAGIGHLAEVERNLVTDVVPDGQGVTFAARVRPNPARGRALIRFSLPSPGHVRLLIYDVAGHLVARLADGPRAAGHHEAWFPGAAPRAAQLYLYRLEWGGKALTGKLVVVP